MRPGPVVFVSYEHDPAELYAMSLATGLCADLADRVFAPAVPEPLFFADGAMRGRAVPGKAWPVLWGQVRERAPSLVVIDPAPYALEGVSVSEAGPVRAFMGALAAEARAANVAVLLVCHDTKAARNAARAGEDPGAGAVAGSATWHDAARAVLYLHRRRRETGGPVEHSLECVKANYGPSGWTVDLEVQFRKGDFAGFAAAGAQAPRGADMWAGRDMGS